MNRDEIRNRATLLDIKQQNISMHLIEELSTAAKAIGFPM